MSQTGTRLAVRLTPRAGTDRVDGMGDDGALRVRVAAPAVDDAANQAMVQLLAKVLGIAPSSVRIVAGQHSRRKTLAIDGVTDSELAARWPGLAK